MEEEEKAKLTILCGLRSLKVNNSWRLEAKLCRCAEETSETTGRPAALTSTGQILLLEHLFIFFSRPAQVSRLTSRYEKEVDSIVSLFSNGNML